MIDLFSFMIATPLGISSMVYVNIRVRKTPPGY